MILEQIVATAHEPTSAPDGIVVLTYGVSGRIESPLLQYFSESRRKEVSGRWRAICFFVDANPRARHPG